jgi:hypothetical protein
MVNRVKVFDLDSVMLLWWWLSCCEVVVWSTRLGDDGLGGG